MAVHLSHKKLIICQLPFATGRKMFKSIERQSLFISLYIYSSYRSSRPEVFCKKGVLKNFKSSNIHWKHLCWTLFVIKLQRFSLQLYYKRDYLTEVFLWILLSFQENLFSRTPPGDCLCVFYLFLQFCIKRAFWMILQYFRNCSCKLGL